MEQLKRTAVLLELASKMRAHGSWCGETHIQKAAFLFQEIAGAQLGFDFVLYKHGPFSFELRDELLSLSGDGFLEQERQPGYGPKLGPSKEGLEFKQKFPKTLAKNAEKICFIADMIGDKGVTELERLATAVFVTKHRGSDTVGERAKRLNQIKPHILMPDAMKAIEDADLLISRAKSKGLHR